MMKDTIQPITPDDVVSAKLSPRVFPPAVINVFNQLIAKHWTGTRAVVGQNEAVAGVMSALNASRSEVFAQRWLDVEPLFEAAGWDVYYDKPGYSESYEATFTFTKKK